MGLFGRLSVEFWAFWIFLFWFFFLDLVWGFFGCCWLELFWWFWCFFFTLEIVSNKTPNWFVCFLFFFSASLSAFSKSSNCSGHTEYLHLEKSCSGGAPLKARHREAKMSFQKVSGFHFLVSQGLFQGTLSNRWLGDPQNGNLQF